MHSLGALFVLVWLDSNSESKSGISVCTDRELDAVSVHMAEAYTDFDCESETVYWM